MNQLSSTSTRLVCDPESVICLGDVANARSGDKGNHGNIGVIAYSLAGFEYLRQELTSERVGNFFSGLGITRTERFELPRLWALNFMLYDALAGGASQSLRIDTQGKLLGTAILELELPRPPNLNDMLRRPNASGLTSASTPSRSRL